MKFIRIFKPLSWISVLTVLSFFTGGCSTIAPKESYMHNNIIEKKGPLEQEKITVALINEGQKSFFYKLSDGYFYPIEIIEPVFIETLPLKIKANLFHQKRVASVVVEKLVPVKYEADEILEVEVFIEKAWRKTFDGHWDSKQYVARMKDSDSSLPYPLEVIRIKNSLGETK